MTSVELQERLKKPFYSRVKDDNGNPIIVATKIKKLVVFCSVMTGENKYTIKEIEFVRADKPTQTITRDQVGSISFYQSKFDAIEGNYKTSLLTLSALLTNHTNEEIKEVYKELSLLSTPVYHWTGYNVEEGTMTSHFINLCDGSRFGYNQSKNTYLSRDECMNSHSVMVVDFEDEVDPEEIKGEIAKTERQMRELGNRLEKLKRCL